MFGVPFYHKTVRKLVIAFGSLFNNITLIRFNQSGVEVDRQKVPIAYSTKEKFLMRLNEDPDLTKGTQMSLPRMGFEITGINYDPQRKQQSTLKNFASANSNTSVRTQFAPVPYQFSFALYIQTRNIEDGWQIVERILPYFNPDYTLAINFVPEMGDTRDVPFILEGIDYQMDDEGGQETIRKVIWTLNFTVQAYLFPAVVSGKYIRSAVANTYDITTQTQSFPNEILMDAGGTGVYKTNEYVFQGSNFATSEIKGIVVDWNDTARILQIKSIGEKPYTNDLAIKGYETGATWTANSVISAPIQMQKITVNVAPITANVSDPHTYDIDIQEFLNIGD